jgi:capsular exopolysaccharide synthesis family protein
MGKLHAALKKADQKRPRAPAPPAASAHAPASTSISVDGETAMSSTGPVYIPASLRGDVDPRLVVLSEPVSPIAEAYRAARESLRAVAKERSWKAFAVTSAASGEGRTISVANLACALSEDPDLKVVVVDADLRSPALHTLLGVDNQRGLSDYLSGGTLLEMALQRSRLTNLWVLPAGHAPANPAELITGNRAEDLGARLRRDYDLILFDTPSLAAATDAVSLGGRMDGTLLVVRMGRTPRDEVKAAADLLAKSGIEVAGTLLTAA